MSKVNKLVATGLMAGMLMAGSVGVHAAEAEVGADVVSSYVWRGITLNADAVVQPSVNVEHESGLGLNIWANFDLGDDDGAYEKREFSEVDFTVYYSFDLEPVTITVGYIEYVYPAHVDVIEEDEVAGSRHVGATADREAFIGVGTELLPGLSVDLTAYQNLAKGDGTYVILSGSYGLEVVEGFTLALNGSVAYTAKNALNAPLKAGMHDYLVGLSADMAVTEALAVNAFINYVGSLDTDVLPSDWIREDVFGGVGAYYAF